MLVTIPFGLAVGLALGTLGAGGSILAIPVLVHLAGLDVHAATTASLVVVGVTAAVGTLPHMRAGRVHVRAGLTFAAVGGAGSVVGSWLNQRASEDLLLLGFGTLALAMAALVVRRAGTSGPADGDDADAPVHPPWTRVAALGTAVGVLTGLFGVGGGFVVVPALILLLGYPTRDAVGTSLVIIALNAGIAMLARLPNLDVDWAVVLPFAIAGVIGSFFGSAVARRTKPQRLAFLLAGLLIVVAGVTGLPAATNLASG